MDVNPANKLIESIKAGFQFYMMGSKDAISNISFKIEFGNGNLISFNRQSIIFIISFREV